MASDLNDSIRNPGRLFGDVDLKGGDDLHDGRGGTVEGLILGGAGSDTVRAQAGAEVIDGGDRFIFDTTGRSLWTAVCGAM